MGIFKSKARREKEMKFVASKLQADFIVKDEWGLRQMLQEFKLFRIGGSKKIRNIISEKNEELEWYTFDYRYIISTGNSAIEIDQTVFFLYSKKLGLPEFIMKPEGLFHKIGTWLGYEDIDFEEYPEFSDQYYLKGEYEEFIRETFHEGVLKLFSVEKNWYMEGMGYYLIFYKKNKNLKTFDIVNFHEKAQFVFEKFKNESDEFLTEKEDGG